MRNPAQAMVEFALAVSVFMLLLLGTFDLVRGYLAYTVVTNVVREVTRYSAAHISDGNYSPTQARLAGLNLAVGLDSAQPPVLTLGLPVTATYPPDPTTYITVSATYQFQALTPVIGGLWGNNGTIPITVNTATPVG